MPRLTIAIPTVNRAYILGEAIESALAQTCKDIEIIVSDNGSTDDTPALIARYAGRGLRTFRHESTMPHAQHGQFILAQVQGEFVVWLSDDDTLLPEYAAEVLAAYDRHPETSFVYTGGFYHYEDIQMPAMVGPPLESAADFFAGYYAGKRDVIWCACAMRIKDIRELLPSFPKGWVCGDLFFWTKIAFKGPVGCVPRDLVHYILLRERNDNMSHGTTPMVWSGELRQVSGEAIQRFRQNGASPEFLARLEAAVRSYTTRLTVNQFLLTRVRGASIGDAMRWSVQCLPYFSFSWPVISRMGAAFILPRKVIKRLWLKGCATVAARRLAERNTGS
jgi:glycosyltransferase involved in cell wall biosynthesis